MGTNTIISGMFAQMADALASQRDTPFKIAAYRKAAKVLVGYPVDVGEAYQKGGIKALTAIPGIGAALSNAVHGIPSFIFFMKEVGVTAKGYPLFYIF